MASWIDNLAQDYFEDIPIEIETLEYGAGRERKIVRAINYKGANYQDLGVLPRTFTLTFSIYGDNYHEKRDRMLALFETPGPYRMKIWQFGELKVIPTAKPTLRETRDALGKCSCSLPVMVDNENNFETKLPKVSSLAVVSSIKAANMAIFASSFEKPKGSYLNGLTSGITKVTTTLAGISGKIGGIVGNLETAGAQINLFKDSAQDLLNTPNRFANGIATVLGAAFGLLRFAKNAVEEAPGFLTRPLVSVAQTAIDGLTDLFEIEPESFEAGQYKGGDAVQAKVQKQALALMFGLIRVQALAEVASFFLGPDRDFRTASEVEMARDRWLKLSRDLRFSQNLPTGVFSQLTSLEAEVYRAMTDLANTLPRSVTLVLKKNRPSLVLAWELYADASKHEEILSLNPTADVPLKLPAGVELTVLSYDSI